VRWTREFVTLKDIAGCVLASGGASLTAAAFAGPSVCIDTITQIELVHRVRQDAYFTHNAASGQRLRIEYDGCGYRILVGERSLDPRGFDVLLVDRYGHVTRVVHQH
jgi:hypothetical protein